MELPGISFNDSFLLSGVDLSRSSGDLYISAGARPAFFTNGANLSGPNCLVRYNPYDDQVRWVSDLSPTIEKIERQVGHRIGGFQDQAEDQHGNAYFMSTWGNVMLRVDPDGNASPFYVPSSNNGSSAGFGGLFTLGETLVVSDGLTESFTVFNLSNQPATSFNTIMSGQPKGKPSALCDSLYAPEKDHGRIALCAADFFSPTGGGVVVYHSNDSWVTATYLGIVPDDYSKALKGTVTATFEIQDSIYAVVAYLPDLNGDIPKISTFPIIDITRQVANLVDDGM